MCPVSLLFSSLGRSSQQQQRGTGCLARLKKREKGETFPFLFLSFPLFADSLAANEFIFRGEKIVRKSGWCSAAARPKREIDDALRAFVLFFVLFCLACILVRINFLDAEFRHFVAK
jgi:hypothetical protein